MQQRDGPVPLGQDDGCGRAHRRQLPPVPGRPDHLGPLGVRQCLSGEGGGTGREEGCDGRGAGE